MGLAGTKPDAIAEKAEATLARLQAIAHAGSPGDSASAALFLAGGAPRFIAAAEMILGGGPIAGRRHAAVPAGGAVRKRAIG